ncbi:glycosyl hydrolase family 28 protein [Flavonifractor hominis]|uniref:Glycosyl hydrolase family 28 protein n=1 Tax=Flavonifractor hominis TaxID=3133178 RepID=A0ABV1EN58_9FIRM
MKHSCNAALKRLLSGVLAASMLCSLTVTGAFAAEPSQSGVELTYTVAEGLDFDDTSVFSGSEDAWTYADSIVEHVDSAVDEMRDIFAQRTVTITDEPYNAEPHERFALVEGTYKKSAEDTEAEIALAAKNTKAIYQAIKDVSEAGGGTVVVPAVDGQVFYTSAIHLEDNVNLHIEEGATLAFTTDYASYQGDLMKEVYGDGVDDQGLTLTRFESVELMNFSPFIYAYGKENIAITGKGTLDGQASTGDGSHPETMTWHEWKSSRNWTTDSGTTKIEAQNAPRTKLFAQGQTNVPVAERQYGISESQDTPWSGADDGFLRPNFIQPYNCQNVLIEGVNVVNSPMWEINPVLCDTVMVQDVYVESHMHNNDGCDPEASSNVVIQNNRFDVGDDCIAIKSGRNGDGLRIGRASFNIVIQDNTFVDGHGGVTIGSEITSGVKNIFSRNNEMDSDQLQAAYRFKTNYIRGGVIENIYYKNDTVKMVESGKPVILVDLNYDVSKEVQMMEAMMEDFPGSSYAAYIPQFKHVLFEGMSVNAAGEEGKGGKYALQLNGFPISGIADSAIVSDDLEDCYISDFTIKDSTFVGSQQGFSMNYVDGLTLDNVTMKDTANKDSVTNCKNLTFTNCDFSDSAVERSTFAGVENAILTGTTFKGETPSEPETPSEGHIDLSGLTEYNGVKLATGATVTKESLLKEDYKVNIEDFGAVALEDRASGDTDTHAVENTKAINDAIKDAAAHEGGGTVVFPAGTFRCYTIELQSNVNLYLEKDCVVQAAKTTMYGRDGSVTSPAEDFNADGTPGNYLQPEVNIYAGLQDGGHTYFANSLIYAADKENIMIYGEGRLDGSQLNDEGTLDQVLQGGDPSNPSDRTGQTGTWYGNKGIALVRCENVVLADFDILNGGHFAIITEGGRNYLIDGMVIDTNRDALDVDCTQDVTIINSHFNSLTDDAIVFKASYGAGVFQPVQNCLVKDCVVSGYDAGSVLAGTYTTDKQVATDRCGPTARIKFGTESTCGYNTVTIDGVQFDRSRGFCLEAVDGSPIHDILMVNAEMDTVSSSPIFIRIGNRGRYPVTGNSTDTALSQPNNVRITNNGWIIPQNTEGSEYTWTEYPIQRYFPAYNTSNKVTMPNGVTVSTVDPTDPVKQNTNNFYEEDGKYYAYKWDEATKTYVVDKSTEINPNNNGVDERDYYGDAVGYSDLAEAYNIYVGNVKITNVDPRYPITLAGLVDSKIQNVTFENIDVTYRGGMRMADAVEQQQLDTDWEYTQYMTAPTTQSLPWLVNTFFTKNAALLPRVVWDADTNSWVDDPYNVPEMPEQYPEPSNFGILPAYGLYARHVDGLKLINVTFSYEVADERHGVVLDDCQNVDFVDFSAETEEGVAPVALVTNNYKRHTAMEYVPNEPYFTTTCSSITGLDSADILRHTVNAPEPSTPKDNLYGYDTIATADNGYTYSDPVWTYNGKDFDLPVTVHRPFFEPVEDQNVKAGETLTLTVVARNPAAETEGVRDQAASDATLTYSVQNLPDGASFNASTHTLTWTPTKAGTYEVTFVADDGVLPVSTTATITVTGSSDSGSDGSDSGSDGSSTTNPPVVIVRPAFNDIANQWYTDAANYVGRNGIMSGVGGGRFDPDGFSSRAMVAQVIYNMEGSPATAGVSGFTDVLAGQWYTDAVTWNVSAKIVNGYGNGLFGTNDNVTREQLVVLLYRYAQYKGYGTSASGSLAAFVDSASVSDWATQAMSWAVANGIINGKDGARLDPQGTATRAEMAKILMVFCQKIAQ